MSRTWSLVGSAVFLLLAPGVVAGLVPWLVTRWRLPADGWPAPAATVATILAGAMILGAAVLLLDCFLRFALEGRGTPAPPAPTRKLVVTGAYRFVRNPMYVAVLALVFGQALAFRSGELVVYGAVLWLAFHVFVERFEEPRLRREFPQEYAEYRRHVRRWLPRLTPWRGVDG